LDCFLNENGTALASGEQIPVRFGTFHWGLGATPGRWAPTTTGANFDVPPELKVFEPYMKEMNVFSNFDLPLSGKPSLVHYTGTFGIITGAAPAQPDFSESPSLDVIVADAIGGANRFRSLQLTATGDPKASYSRRTAASVNPAETSAFGFYQRVFGAGYQDPNSAVFTPNPQVKLDLGVLSGVMDERKQLLQTVGAADKQRLDQYFTSVRELENQMQLQLKKPPPAEACVRIEQPAAGAPSFELESVMENNRIMARLLAMCLACNQTRVFSMALTNSQSDVYKSGDPRTHHIYTHEEAVDKTLGYQPTAAYFVGRNLHAFSEFVGALAAVREGAGTLLDNTLVFAYSDTSYAKTHAVNGIPVMLAGRAGGRMKTGIHIDGAGAPVSRIGLTAQQLMGLQVGRWGVDGLQTDKPISEIMT
jgi:hypothetical protein